MVRVGIIGASGYTGAEAIEILLRHGTAELTYLSALPEECGAVGEVFPRFKGRVRLNIEPLDIKKAASAADIVFCCLPHKISMEFVPKLLAAGLKVIDFSADYRIKDAATYEKFYEVKHRDTANLAKAVYGLPELFREKVRKTDLIANPGCFPTGAILAIAPLLKNGLIKCDTIIVNSVTGTSGAGKTPSKTFHFPNMNENIFAYGIGRHRHMPEIEQIASELAEEEVKILFQPHVGPFDRGILSTVYSEPIKSITGEELMEIYKRFYDGERFVQVTGCSPSVKDVAYSNYCHVFPTVVKGRIITFSVIDNLVKGASGQAVQNMNIMLGMEEQLGLE